MATKIEWTDTTWNPVIGCAKVSAGCKNCYAETMAVRLAAMAEADTKAWRNPGKKAAYRDVVLDGRWNGRARFVPDSLAEPLQWRSPRRVFVNSMSDLFHEDVRFEEIAAVFGMMAACPQHTFQVLSKRPERMREFFAGTWSGAAPTPDRAVQEEIASAAAGHTSHEHPRVVWDARGSDVWRYPVRPGIAAAVTNRRPWRWPLPNVWLGVSVENQRSADVRIPPLLQCPAAVRFLSCEPLLEPVDLLFAAFDGSESVSAMDGISWVIIGGESGHGARPFDLAWARSIIAQCKAAGAAVFMKQLGGMPISSDMDDKRHSGNTMLPSPFVMGLHDKKGGDMAEWPEDLRVRQFPVIVNATAVRPR